MSRRKVAYITGTRSDYGVMRSVLTVINNHPDLELHLVVTGMHLLEQFGNTVSDIENDGFVIGARIPADAPGNNPSGMIRSLGGLFNGVAAEFERSHPDIILVQGDRGESLVAALAGAYLRIPVAHVSGGDVTEGGMVDDSIRHCITKLSHLHFPGTPTSARRIECMGEDPSRVYMVGTPSLITLKEIRQSDIQKTIEHFRLDGLKPVIIVLQHPVTYESDHAADQMRETLEAIVQLGEQTIIIYPNSDSGADEIIRVIESYSHYPFIRTTKNLPYMEFITLLSIASVLVGNSSAGIVRTPLLGLPCINIGTRQKNREHANNITDVDYNRDAILSAINAILKDKDIRTRILREKSPYADEDTSERIAQTLATVDIGPDLLIKKFYYCV